MTDEAVRGAVLDALGATADERAELLRYNANHFDPAGLDRHPAFPLPDEPFVPVWEDYARDAASAGAWPVLRRALVQLRFPVRTGISETPAYRDAVRRLAPVPETAPALALRQPETVRIAIHATPAGRLPVIIAPCRDDFVRIVQALTTRNEPIPVPAAVGACMVAGYVNVDRLRRLQAAWRAEQPFPTDAGWTRALRALLPRKALYQDRFIIASTMPYSAVPADGLGLEPDAWARLSLAIRIEHESMHYFTRRVFGSMKNRLIDEVIADYAGIVQATGRFRADWALRFLGLEAFPAYRSGGRLERYRGDPPLSDGAWRILHRLVHDAITNLDAFTARRAGASPEAGHLPTVAALTRVTVEELAAPDAAARLDAAIAAVGPRVGASPAAGR